MKSVSGWFYLVCALYVMGKAGWVLYLDFRYNAAPSGLTLTLGVFCGLCAFADLLTRWARESRVA